MNLRMLLLAGVVCVAGCRAPESANETRAVTWKSDNIEQQDGEFVTEFGKKQIGSTVITADAQKISVAHITTHERAGMKSKISSKMSPGTWTLKDGWFAYVQRNGELVWLHDGGEGLLLVERKSTRTEQATNTYGVENFFPVAVPEAVLSRLKEPLRTKAKQAKKGKE